MNSMIKNVRPDLGLITAPPRPYRNIHRSRCCLSVESAATGPPISFHVNETTITFPFTEDRAKEVSTSIQTLLQTFAAKQAAERPKKWQSMEYRYKGDAEDDQISLLELFCNPNAYSSAFDARVLLTLKTSNGVSVTTEGRLSAIKCDLDNYLGQQK